MKRLTLVPTPIGNLGDITRRAIDVLRDADAIAAEDTRRSGVLLTHLGLDRRLERLDAHTMERRGPALLAEHDWLAFVTDAGTPGISDPGADLVRLALESGHQVEVLPGATAFVPALVASGLPTSRFTFEGFLPRKGSARKRRLEAIAASTATSVLYESPYRLASTLADLITSCGTERDASVSRELSKLYEETRRGSLEQLHEHYRSAEVKGEVVVVVGPAQEPGGPAPNTGAAAALGADFAQVAARLASSGVRGRLLRGALEALGAPRNLAYRLAHTAADSAETGDGAATDHGEDE